MSPLRQIRPAVTADIPAILDLLEAARGIMRADGNLHQWADGYPRAEDIAADLERGCGFVLEEKGAAIGYFAFLPAPEPTYAQIYEGAWLDDALPYHVIHRIASGPGSHGVFRDIMDWAFAWDRNIRIDTHRDNHIMQHNIRKYGFSYCGIIYLASGDERLAYQRLLSHPDPVKQTNINFY